MKRILLISFVIAALCGVRSAVADTEWVLMLDNSSSMIQDTPWESTETNTATGEVKVRKGSSPANDPDRLSVLATLRGPVLGIFAEKDTWITKEMALRFEAALTKARAPHVVKVFAADHAFFNPRSPTHDAACAAEAWTLLAEHFTKNLVRTG